MPAALNSSYGRHKRTVRDHIREAKVSNCLLLTLLSIQKIILH